MRRKIISIDQEKCNGCGICVPDCPEGALQVIDGKARLVGDLLCDGLGACLKSCPENAIFVEEREAEPYNELNVLANIIPQGSNVLRAHLKHLKDHGQAEYLQQALSYLQARGISADLPLDATSIQPATAHCPGSQTMSFPSIPGVREDIMPRQSQLTHWPIQLHLISPSAPHYRNSDLLIAADCVAYTSAGFHNGFLSGRTLAIACPKLDSNQEVYLEKLAALIDQAKVRSIQVMIMQVPCCNGLLRLVVEAARRATHKAPVTCLIMSIQGQVLTRVIHEAS